MIRIPYEPRPLQRVLHEALDAHRFAVAVCHRRFGKTVLAINQLQKRALTCDKPRPRYAYLAPFRNQAKDVAWGYMKHFAAPIPGVDVNESELRITYPNGAQLRIYGADNQDALRGIYLDGVVLDEYGQMSSTIWGEVIRPLLSDREGWAFFIGTPNGKNQFYDVVKDAQTLPGWYFASFRASDTGVLPFAELQSAQQSMTTDQYAQEYECSFEASVKGAVYAQEMRTMVADGRIARVPYESLLPVNTYWDLGIGDATAIWFAQITPSGELRLIDYYENQGEPLTHYIGVVKAKPYVYGEHWAPHDIEVREYTTGHSRVEVARQQNLTFQVGKRLPIEDGINAVRMVLPRCWFDAERTERGREALQAYRYRLNTRLDEYDRHQPEHDWASHGADAFRLLGLQHYTPSAKQIAQFGQRQMLQNLMRETERAKVVGPTGESLQEAMVRVNALGSAYRDQDRSDPRWGKGTTQSRRGRF